MKIGWKSIIFLVITSLFVQSVGYGQEEQPCEPDIVVMFGNGVLTHFDKAYKNRILLQNRLNTHISGSDLEGKISYDTSHNPTAGYLLFFLDFFETYVQDIQTNHSNFWRYLAGLDPMPDILQDKFKAIASEIDAVIVSTHPSVQEHITIYNGYLREGNIVVLVPHSQGNLYGNIAYLGIDQKYRDGFGIVSVANPDNHVAGGGPYTTIEEDYVISPLQFIYPYALSPNRDNFFGPINLANPLGHGFRKSYMAAGHDAETKILDDIVNKINDLNSTAIECGCSDANPDSTTMTANFTYLITLGGPDNLPVTFQFTDTSTGSPNKWLWDFGDGFTSESQNPSHTYAATGSYIVKLKAFVQTGVTDVTQVFVSGRERTGAGSTGIIGAYNNWLAASWVNKPPGTSEVRWSLNLYWPWWWFVTGDAVFSYNLVPYSSGVAELQIYLYPISGGNNHGVIITGSGQLIDSSVATGWRTVKDVSGSLGTLIQESYTNHDGYPNNGAGGYYSTTSRVRVWVSTDIDTDCQSVLVWP